MIDTTYTIRYSKGGIAQFANFNYSDGVLKSHNFCPRFVKISEIPSLEGLNEIEDILKVIKDWSFCNQARIILKNGNLPDYKSDEKINKCSQDFEKFFNKLCFDFFKSEILPILRKNKWKISVSWAGCIILIKKYKKEWVNVDSEHNDSMLIDNICNEFLRKVINSRTELNFSYQHRYSSGNSFSEFFSWLPRNELEKTKIFIIVE
jgi:hypothetical protein